MPAALCAWYERAKRDLPWRRTHDPYAVWISEVMLQQTRVKTVIPYFRAFMDRWPTLVALSGAREQDVLKAWEGLGYYSRVRNLLSGARYIVKNYGGRIPSDAYALKKIPGIGTYTAGAIRSIAFNMPSVAVDANVLRVFARLFAIGTTVQKTETRKVVETHASNALHGCSPRVFNQAVMELGALVCVPKSPSCGACPVSGYCAAYAAGLADSLPKKSPLTPKRVVCLAVAIVQEPGGAVLVRKRENGGLLHGLWEFPNWEVRHDGGYENAVRSGLNELGIPTDRVLFKGEARHTFTHLIWTMRGFKIYAPKAPSLPGCVWKKAEDLNGLAWSSAMGKWRKAVLDTAEQ